MELNIHSIIKGPRVSEKARLANKKLNQLVLEVHPQATKCAIKMAVQRLFGVKVTQVRTLINKTKKSKSASNRRRFVSNTVKKTKIAYVSLIKGHTLDLLGQTEQVSMGDTHE